MFRACISRSGTLKTSYVQLRVAPHIDADYASAYECKVFHGTRVKVLNQYLDFAHIGTEEHPPRFGYVAKEHVVFYTDGERAAPATSKDASSPPASADSTAPPDCLQASDAPIPSKIVVMNCAEGIHAKFVNGVFEPTKQIQDGFPVYVKIGDDRKKIIEHRMGEWQIKPVSSKVPAQHSCFPALPLFSAREPCLPHYIFVTCCARRVKTAATRTSLATARWSCAPTALGEQRMPM
jgi:hypothetical protein